MFALIVLTAAIQSAAPHAPLDADIERFGRWFIVANRCSGVGYEVDVEPLHQLEADITERAAAAGVSAAQVSRIISASIVRHETQLPPRDLPENYTLEQFAQRVAEMRQVYPLRCGELAREAPEIITVEAVRLGDAQLIERMDLYAAFVHAAPD